MLVEFALRLKASVRATDTVARLAGDEFVVLLEDIHEVADASGVAATILGAMQPSLRYLDHDIAFGASIGIALAANAGETAEHWLQRADLALYAAKSAGRGAWRVADD